MASCILRASSTRARYPLGRSSEVMKKPGISSNRPRVMLACLLAVVLIIAAACSSGNGGTASNAGSSPPAGGSSNQTQPSGDAKKNVTLTYWGALGAGPARSLQTFNDSLLYQELEKRTGVKIAFEHPAVGSEGEQFNLLIASGKYPDMIEYNFNNYPGGPEKALADNVIIELNDVIKQYAPNLNQYLNENPDMKKQVSTDSGKMYVFPSIGIGNNGVTTGFMLRKDWLDELGLKAPETIDDWTKMLRAFKESKGAKAPVTMLPNNFLYIQQFNGAFGVGTEFYLDNGKVKYGPIEQGYKQYLTLLNAWYKEGLLDPDFATQDGAAFDAKIINGNSGALLGAIGGGMGKYLPALQAKDKKYDLVGVQYPVLKAGEEPRFITTSYEYRGTGSVAITTSNRQVEETAKWLDYFYSDEGHMLKSFGVEGLTYTDDKGYPRYTDLIMKNKDGLTISDAMSKYLRVNMPWVGFVGDDRYSEQYFATPQQQAASVVFSKYQNNAYKTRLPLISHTPEEANKLTTIMAEVNTYRDEMFLKFVMGSEPLDKFDDFVNQLKRMNIEKAIEFKTAAVERYNKR
ncbi:ABC transporter substrate-binding protein [Paenibacillus sp. YN15]|nr:ABC transporter substrate-binding protein [Paenibacillus sp. YN15]